MRFTEFDLHRTRLDGKLSPPLSSPITHFIPRLRAHTTDGSACFFFPPFSCRHGHENDGALRAMGKIAYFLIFREIRLSPLREREAGEGRRIGRKKKGIAIQIRGS